MGAIVTTIFESVSGVVTGIITAFRDAFSQLIWQDPDATEKVLSDFAQFGLTFLGISIVIGIVYAVVAMVRK